MSNPILNEDRFSPRERVLEGEPMTISGTVNKIFMLFVCLLAGSAISVYSLFTKPDTVPLMIVASGILAFILVIATCFNIRIAKYTAAPYALFEGLLLGAISMLFEAQWHGIVLQARIIRYTAKFQAVLMTAMFSVLAIYLIQFIASFFGRGIPLIWEAGTVGIVFSLIVIGIAAFSLVQDFFFIESASQNMLSKDYEWYGAMGLMITLIWLYMEILRLFAKLNSRN